MNTLSCVAFLLLIGDGVLLAAAKTDEQSVQRTSINNQVQVQSQKLLSILLVSTLHPGHLITISALGTALVRRGHNVTLCTTEREGHDLPQQLAERTGMTWLSAGPDALPTAGNEQQQQARIQRMNILNVAIELAQSDSRIADALMSNHSHARKWNIIIYTGDDLGKPLSCLSMKWNLPIVLVCPTLDTTASNLPHWPYPNIGTMFTDDMTFSQRLVSMFFNAALGYFEWYIKLAYAQTMSSDCKQFHHKLYHLREGYIPTIVSTAVGFEFSRPILPLVHYVGPLVLKDQETIPDDISIWLEKQAQNSVVYISMGSVFQLSENQGSAFANGALQTNFNILWSLRASNRDILEGLSLDKKRVFISEWIPQTAVLQSNAIALAVLHGGTGGVGEALSNAVPLVVMPLGLDHFAIAARVQHAGAGVLLDKNTVTASEVKVAIETVGSHASYKTQQGNYRRYSSMQEGHSKLQS